MQPFHLHINKGTAVPHSFSGIYRILWYRLLYLDKMSNKFLSGWSIISAALERDSCYIHTAQIKSTQIRPNQTHKHRQNICYFERDDFLKCAHTHRKFVKVVRKKWEDFFRSLLWRSAIGQTVCNDCNKNEMFCIIHSDVGHQYIFCEIEKRWEMYWRNSQSHSLDGLNRAGSFAFFTVS